MSGVNVIEDGTAGDDRKGRVADTRHIAKALETWARLQQQVMSRCFEIDGQSLHIADVMAVASHGCLPQLTDREDVLRNMRDGVQTLLGHLADGCYVYGTNTGFGGSADSRTGETTQLQAALMQLTQAGVLTQSPDGSKPVQAMPSDWVRATIAVRCNMTLRGHTAVSLPVVKAMAGLLEHQITPVVPLRGSVSASGDLMPLSYIVGAMEGNPDIRVEIAQSSGQTISAPKALSIAGIKPIELGPKEGLGLVNGTAASAALGALVIGRAHSLAVLTQALTGMAVEALQGSYESFDPFIAQVRPHPGQIECARNIAVFLHGSQLARDILTPKDRRRAQGALVQDRYSLRSAPQWLGPQLEDLLSADRQISTELNSSSDNPIVKASTGDILYGANFQAASVSSAMEKTRLALQMMGRLLFAQLTEIADPNLSGGLPASLAADNPSLSFTIKGVEISMASYMAELSYLAAPMTSHMQPAEMHNQSVNSMALTSGRMSMQAVDLLSIMCACSLYSACQALDLRVLHMTFKQKASEAVASITNEILAVGMSTTNRARLSSEIKIRFHTAWDETGKRDIRDRCDQVVDQILPFVLEHIGDAHMLAATLYRWKLNCVEAAFALWQPTFTAFCTAPHTAELLGVGSGALYKFVRQELEVPFHQGLIEHPTAERAELGGRGKKTIGGWISKVHDTIENGSIMGPLMTIFGKEVA